MDLDEVFDWEELEKEIDVLSKKKSYQYPEYVKKWRKNNPDKVRAQYDRANIRRKGRLDKRERHRYTTNRRRKKVYGITVEDYEKMKIAQNYRCAICNKENATKKDLAVDHCHITNKIRSLLCGRCNILLGQCKEDIDILKNAIKYLEKHRINTKCQEMQVEFTRCL